MIFLNIVIYYILSASAILFYGIGINRVISISDNFSSLVLSCIKCLCTASATTSITYFINYFLLLPHELEELYPFIAVVIFVLISILLEIFVTIGIGKSVTEFAIPMLSVILGINEGLSLSRAIVITCSCILSFYLIIGFIYPFRIRIRTYKFDTGLKTYSLLLVFLAVIMFAISGWNSSWCNLIN